MIKLNIQRFGSTNKTTNYELSQFVSSDKPSWLNDINSDMSKIDTAIHTAKTTADGAVTSASNAQTAAEGAQTTANTAVTNAATADAKAETAQSRIGTLANLTTTAKTDLVLAINEVDGNADSNAAKIGTLSSLTTTVKTDLVSAINSIETKIEELDNFSTSETDTGMIWLPTNKKIYRKCYYIAHLPSTSGSTAYDSGITATHLVNIYGCMGSGQPFNASRPWAGIEYTTGLFYDISEQKYKIELTRDLSAYDGWVVIEYTKD